MNKEEKREYMKIYNSLPHAKQKKLEYSRSERGKQIKKEYRKRNPPKYNPEYKKRPLSKFYEYRKNAKKRNLEFLLSIEQFYSFWGGKCYYCNKDIQGVGIDRKDSQIGYTLENCVRCCTICNRAKMQLNAQEFINHIRKIYLFYF